MATNILILIALIAPVAALTFWAANNANKEL